MIYLDNCATTKPDHEVVEEMLKALREDFGNPSSVHSLGIRAGKNLKSARADVANLISANESEIYFTSGGTESNNLAIRSLCKKNSHFGKNIVTSDLEHSSVARVYNYLGELGYEIRIIRSDEYGNIDREHMLELIDEHTALLTLIHVHNELGTINDVKSLIRAAKNKNKKLLAHVDGVQAAAKIPVDVKDIGCDSYSISSHKFYGPKGVGALYVRDGLSLEGIIFGGGQEKNLRSGTENTPGIMGFAKACELAKRDFEKRTLHVLNLRERFLENLEGFEGAWINSPANSSPYILSVGFKNIRSEVLLNALENHEIYISAASACSSNENRRKDSVKKLKKKAEGSIRICFSKYLELKDIDEFSNRLLEAVKEIRFIINE